MTLSIAILGNDKSVIALVGDSLKALGFQIYPDLNPQVEAVVVDDPDQTPLMALVKERDQTLPVLALSQAPIIDADVVMAKPVRIADLADQLIRLVSRNGIRLGVWRFFPKIRLLKSPDGPDEYLTQKESELLDYLIQSARLVSRDDLLQDVFGYSNQTSTHTIETHIHTLRKKLGPDLLITEEAGYRLDL